MIRYVILILAIAAVIAIPYVAYAADVQVEITPGSSAKKTGAYSPDPVQVQVDDTVIWTNADSILHTATFGNPSDGGSGIFGGTDESPELIVPRRSQSYTFTQAGEFQYYCVLHPVMTGKVSVVERGADLLDSSIPVTVDGRMYVISAKSETTRIIATTLKPENISLTFDKGGKAEVELPKAVLANISGVVAGTEMLEYQVEGEDEMATRISFEVPEDNMEIVIVPEFPAAMILLVTALGSMAVVVRRVWPAASPR